MNYVTFITRNLENVPGKSGVGQGKSVKSQGIFFFKVCGNPVPNPYRVHDSSIYKIVQGDTMSLTYTCSFGQVRFLLLHYLKAYNSIKYNIHLKCLVHLR